MAVPLLPLILGAGAVGGIVRYVIATLGFGIVSIIGLGAILSQLSAYVQTMITVPPEAVSAVCVLQLKGITQIVLSAYAVKVALFAAKRFRVL